MIFLISWQLSNFGSWQFITQGKSKQFYWKTKPLPIKNFKKALLLKVSLKKAKKGSYFERYYFTIYHDWIYNIWNEILKHTVEKKQMRFLWWWNRQNIKCFLNKIWTITQIANLPKMIDCLMSFCLEHTVSHSHSKALHTLAKNICAN